MLGFMGVTAFLSMWISNTAATAMMVPIVEAMLQQMEATTAAAEASLGALELADKGKAGTLPGGSPVRETRTHVGGCPVCCLSQEERSGNAASVSFRNVTIA